MTFADINLLQFSISEVPEAASTIFGFIAENKILAGVLLGAYALVYIYAFINNRAVDSEIYEIDLLSSGISTIMIAFLLVGLDEGSKGFDLSSIDMGSATTKIAVGLLIYAGLLIFFAFTKILPSFLVVLFGNSELDLFINFVAILMTDSSIEITGTVLFAIAAPLLVLLLIQRLRRLM